MSETPAETGRRAVEEYADDLNALAIRESEELVLPHTGVLIDLADPLVCVSSLVEIRELESKLREVKAMLTHALVEESKRQGSKTLTLPGGLKAEVRGGEKVLWDASALMDGLRAAGCPDERIESIVKTEISYTVVAGEAKRAAGANEEYKRIIESCSTTIEERPTIAVRKR